MATGDDHARAYADAIRTAGEDAFQNWFNESVSLGESLPAVPRHTRRAGESRLARARTAARLATVQAVRIPGRRQRYLAQERSGRLPRRDRGQAYVTLVKR